MIAASSNRTAIGVFEKVGIEWSLEFIRCRFNCAKKGELLWPENIG